MTEDSRARPKRGWRLAGLAVAMALAVIGVRLLVNWSPTAPLAVAPESVPAVPAVQTPRLAPAPLQAAPAQPAAARAAIEPEPESIEPPPPEGLHAFPPLGTRQLLSGIIVPEGFVLPPGYVRHRQTTDDGEPLPPILMFHPHQPPLDVHGEPLPVTPDRVVPPGMAPEGMPISLLEAPRSGPPPGSVSRFLEPR